MNEKSSPIPYGRKGWGAGESALLIFKGSLNVAPPSPEVAAHTLYGEGGPAACASTPSRTGSGSASRADSDSAAGKPPPAGAGALFKLVFHITPTTPLGAHAIPGWKCGLARS